MERILEPELMDDAEQAKAYASADFSDPHAMFVELLAAAFPSIEGEPLAVLDLGCGPADVTIRLARRFPTFTIDGVDGSRAMLEEGLAALEREPALRGRITLVEGFIPGARPPRAPYDLVISTSLLHHLPDPAVLWTTISIAAKPGAPVAVMDLRRPGTEAEAERIVREHAGGAPEVLRRDFFNSLCAAFTPGEVREQLRAAGFAGWTVSEVTERHLFVTGAR